MILNVEILYKTQVKFKKWLKNAYLQFNVDVVFVESPLALNPLKMFWGT